MKKTAIFLVAMLVLSMFLLSSCDLLQQIPGLGDIINKPCEEHVDADGDYICDKCEAELEKNDTPDTPCEHADEDKNHLCDLCEEKLSDCEAAEKSHNCKVCGNKLTNCEAADKSHNCAVCGEKLSDCAAAEKSHNCAVCGEKLSDCAAAEKSHNCAVCGEKLSDCAAADKSHNCAVCGEKLSDCADADEDYVCDICGAELERPAGPSTTIVLDPEKDDATAVQGPQVIRIGEFEIILSSEKSRIESKNVTFTLPDGSTSAQNYRINFNGSETIFDSATGTWQNAIKFMTSGKGTVTIYWQHGGKGSQGDESSKAWRNVAIWNDQGEILDQTSGQYAYEALTVTTFEFDGEGTYYIGNLAGANNFFYVEVKYEGEKVSLPTIEKFDVHFSTNGGSAVESIKVESGALIEKPADPTKDGFAFDGWYKDEALTTAWNFSTNRVSAETTLYAKWKTVYTGEYEDVHYELNISDLETGVRGSDDINGKFTIVSGTEVRTRTKTYDGVEYIKSIKIGGSDNKVLVSVPGAGKLTFLIQNGSSGAATQFTQVIGPDGSVYNIEFAGSDDGSPVVKIEINVTEGVWTIARGKNGGTQDIFFLSLDCSVPVSEENGFELVATGNVDFLTGEELDLSGIRLNSTFESGKTDPLALENVTVDTSAVNMAVSGTYPVVISYKEYAPITFYVSVYAPESIELGFDAVEKLGNSAAGNGVYYNHSWKEVYLIGEKLNTDGLSVIVVAKCGDKSLKFKVDDYEITGFDSSYEDYNVLTISASGVEITVTIHVVDTEPTADKDGVYKLLVDPNYEGIAAAISGPYHVFSTIQGALDYAAHIDANAAKELYIAPGYYKEKLEITIPNLTVIGMGDTPADVVIEWDSLYGLPDAGGFTHTTDSTQTVAVRDSATGVTIKNLTISNAFNSKDYFDKTLGENYPEHRALALLVMADRFVMEDCILLGYQDTLELFTGRQYFKNVEIHGYTDFIFGTNNTTLFENCVINTIYSGKTNGGYLTAFKGSNKGAADSITYGAIFYHCQFTADEGVADGLTAIGRPWGAYAAVAVIECELGAHIATTSSGTASQNERYVTMSGVKPTDETVQFVEYNNTGAGAITEAVAGMRFLTAEEVVKYLDFAVIFGTKNGNVSYLDPWDPTATEVVVDDRTYYYFDGTTSGTGTIHTFDTTTTIAKGETFEWAGMLISAVNNVAWNANSNKLNMKAGAFIKFNVTAGSTVTIVTHSGYGYYTINGVGTSHDTTFTKYFAEDTEVTILSTGDLYIQYIVINPGEDAPEAPTLTDVKVSGMKLNYTVGEEISLENVQVKAYYSDNSVVVVNDYTLDSSAVNTAAAGSYDVVFSYGDKTAKATLTFEESNVGPEIIKDTLLDFSTPDGLEAVENNPKVSIEGSVRHNSKEIQIQGTISFQVKAGTAVTVVPYYNSQYVSYTLGMEGETGLETLNTKYTRIFNEDCTVVYTGLSNNYLVSIQISCPLDEGKYVFGGKQIEGDVIGILSTIQGLTISGTCKTHNGGAQLADDSLITFTVPAYTSVVIQGFDTNYGQLDVIVDGQLIEMNDKAQYVFKPSAASLVEIKAHNAGTEEAPDWSKSYITYIEVTPPVVFIENTTIDLSATNGLKIEGGKGEYNGLEVDATNGKFADNSSGWVQVNAGTVVKFFVADGAKVSVTAYGNAANFEIAVADGVCTITCVGNDYLKAIAVTYPVIFGEDTTIDLSATNGLKIEGGKGEYNGLEVDATNGKFADNNSGWVQVNAGTVIKLNVLDGAKVSVTAHGNAANFEIAVADGVCTITCVEKDYLKAIAVTYPVIFGEDTTIDLSSTNGLHFEGSTGEYNGLNIDATNGKFADNSSGWVQVNAGTVIKLNVLDGAKVSVKAYYDAANFEIVVADGVCTITCVGNDYLGAITVKYVSAEPKVFDLTTTSGLHFEGSTGEYNGLNIDATNGKFASNGSWVQVNTGTVITFDVSDGAKVSVTAYSSADNYQTVVADGVCTITCVGNDYLAKIEVNY